MVDTIANRAALAEACLSLGKFDEARALYASILAAPLGDEPSFMLGLRARQFGLGEAAIVGRDARRAEGALARLPVAGAAISSPPRRSEGAGRDQQALAAYDGDRRAPTRAPSRGCGARELLAGGSDAATRRGRSPARSRATSSAPRRTCAARRVSGSPSPSGWRGAERRNLGVPLR